MLRKCCCWISNRKILYLSFIRIFFEKVEKFQRQEDGKKENDDEIWNFIWSKKNFYLISLSLPFKLNLDLLWETFFFSFMLSLEGTNWWKTLRLVSRLFHFVINYKLSLSLFSSFLFKLSKLSSSPIDFFRNNQNSRVGKLASFCICF